MQILYPEIKPYSTHSLKVSSKHEIYIEECGIPDGIPVLFIHGGPGGGCDPTHRRYFDPEVYRIVLFDQRGAGRSEPHAELEDNTTQHLISDIEAIREFLKVDSWVLFGGSWGSTLALVYAQAFPNRVKHMILRGIFLGRDEDVAWLYEEGTPKIFPDYYEQFLSVLSEGDRGNVIESFHRMLTSNNEIQRMAAAKAWSIWEGRTATLHTSHRIVDHFSDPHVALCLARIECHYFINHCFLKPNQILENMDKIEHIPGVIVHGRYDMICSLKNAWDLHRSWASSELQIVRDAGHSSTEPGIIDVLVRATRDYGKQPSETI